MAEMTRERLARIKKNMELRGNGYFNNAPCSLQDDFSDLTTALEEAWGKIEELQEQVADDELRQGGFLFDRNKLEDMGVNLERSGDLDE
jgi:hypothetical protein